MAAHRFKAIIFDLDGTLVDSAGEIAKALARAFEEVRVEPLAEPEVAALVGRGVRSLVERALEKRGRTDLDLDETVARFERHYAALVGTEAALFPGVRPGLDALRAHGCHLAVVTNKPRAFTLRLLESLEIAGLFSTIVAGDEGIRRKPAGDMLEVACQKMAESLDEALMVGDSDNDVLAARAAGCAVWCVPYGYNEGRGPETLACDRLVDTLEEAARLIIARP
jgi:phosphoglycolate phosphatase